VKWTTFVSILFRFKFELFILEWAQDIGQTGKQTDRPTDDRAY